MSPAVDGKVDLHEQLHTLYWSSGSLGDSSGDTTHQEIDHETYYYQFRVLIKVLELLNLPGMPMKDFFA